MTKEKVVIISNYYPPEMGAAANRIYNMAAGLKDKGKEITIICPLPNYPEGRIFSSYKGYFTREERLNDILIKRYWIFPSNSKKMSLRFISMISFAWSLWFSLFWLLRNKPNVVIVQSPPLFVAFSGLLLSKILRSKSVLNVSDLWPLTGLELGILKKGILYSLLKNIEQLNYKLSDKIIGQSNEIIEYIGRETIKDLMVYRNVPFLKEFPTKSKNKNLKIVYAGLLGYAQGILGLCKSLNFKDLNVEFHIYGSGMEESDIVDYINNNDRAIYFHGKKNANEVKNEILKYDIALVRLVNPIYGAVPSKIFELMQLKIPILFNASGEGARIVQDENIGLCSDSSDYISLEKNINQFKHMEINTFKNISKKCFEAHLNRYNLNLELNKLNDFLN